MKRYWTLAWYAGMTSCCLAGFLAFPGPITMCSLAVAWLATGLLAYCEMLQALCEQ